jgi:DeoR/GlpR family transcriptional regulator of sugar metabolism
MPRLVNPNRPTLARLAHIAKELQPDGFISLIETAKVLGVSKATIRRDMRLLESLGYVFEYDGFSTLYWGKRPERPVL